MTDRTLPWWLRASLLISALAQIYFGFTLLADPGAITRLWPWELTPFTARLLGASTLVSVPLAVISIYFNRLSAARIPLVMMTAYRVLQISAGLIHIDRFDLASPTAINYFGGGGFLLAVQVIVLIWGSRLGSPIETPIPALLRGDSSLVLDNTARWVLRGLAVLYFSLGLLFLILGEGAEFVWSEAPGNLTGLTARLFASPTMGLALAMWLITRAAKWHEVGIPAIGMATFGLSGLFVVIVEWASIVPPTPLGYLVPLTPLILLLVGLYLLMPARSAA